jgi:hypothetical protein
LHDAQYISKKGGKEYLKARLNTELNWSKEAAGALSNLVKDGPRKVMNFLTDPDMDAVKAFFKSVLYAKNWEDALAIGLSIGLGKKLNPRVGRSAKTTGVRSEKGGVGKKTNSNKKVVKSKPAPPNELKPVEIKTAKQESAALEKELGELRTGPKTTKDPKKEKKIKKIPKYKNTKPVASKYVGEETGSVWGTKVKYLSEAERKKYKLTIKDGRLYDSVGELFDTKSASSVFPDGGGKAIFVMDEYGNIYASKMQAVGEFHHSSFLAGKPVAAAGEISIENGVVKEITRRSGHYMPSEKHLNQFVTELRSQGVGTETVKIVSGF